MNNDNKYRTYFVQFQVDVLLLLKQRRGLTLIWSPHWGYFLTVHSFLPLHSELTPELVCYRCFPGMRTKTENKFSHLLNIMCLKCLIHDFILTIKWVTSIKMLPDDKIVWIFADTIQHRTTYPAWLESDIYQITDWESIWSNMYIIYGCAFASDLKSD